MICLNRNLFERLLGFTGLLALTSWFFYENYTLETTEYDISSEKLPDEFDEYRICHLSDLHNRSFGYKTKNIIQRVKKTNPDISPLLSGHLWSLLQPPEAVMYRFYLIRLHHNRHT